jgi:hypothetical protein
MKIFLKLGDFHAWSGNKGVNYTTFTVLTPILTPGMEILGSKHAFQRISSQEINKIVNSNMIYNFTHTPIFPLYLFLIIFF